MINVLPRNIVRFIVLVLFQGLILNNIQVTSLNITPLMYVMFILLLPFETPGWLLLILSFTIGISVDYFSDTSGLHAAACVLLGFLRPVILRVNSPRDGYEAGTYPRLSHYGLNWFLKYSIFLVIVHHITYFLLGSFMLSLFPIAILKAILTSFFSVVLIVISQYFIFNK